MIKRFLYIILFIFSFFRFIEIYADSIDTYKYTEKIKTCLLNQENPLAISDFVCIKSTKATEIAAQIILDTEFSKIDKQIEDYLENLFKSKDICFWENKKKNYTECIDDIYNNFSATSSSKNSFVKLYNNICDNVILDWLIKSNWWNIPLDTRKEYIKWNNLHCKNLAKTKLFAYKNVAYDILKENKYQIQKDENKKFTQEQRTKYNKFVDLININLRFLQRILSKWPNKTQNCK